MSNDLVQNKANNLKTLLEKSKNEIAAALPAHLTPQRLSRIAFTEVRKNPKLLECEPTSFIGAVIQAAQLGLEPGSALGQCWLIPYFNGRTKKLEVQFQVGYKGMLSLVSRSSDAPKLMPRAVYKGDDFNFEYGMDEMLKHKPNEKSDELTHVYVVAAFKDGTKAFMVMSRKEIDAVRKRSKSADSGPWESDFEAMALKSVIRKMFKYLPSSVEMQNAIGLDEAGERGEQDNSSVYETTGSPIETQQSKTDEFKQKINAAITEPDSSNHYQNSEVPEFNSEEEGDFDKYRPAALTHKAEKPQEQSQSDLVLQVLEAANSIGLNLQAVVERCKKDFKKDPREMDIKELSKMLSQLKKEAKK